MPENPSLYPVKPLTQSTQDIGAIGDPLRDVLSGKYNFTVGNNNERNPYSGKLKSSLPADVAEHNDVLINSDFYPGQMLHSNFDNAEIRAENQSTFDKLYNGTIRFLDRAGSTFVGGVGFLGSLPAAALSGDITVATDNWLTKWSDWANEYGKKRHPVYETHEYQNMSPWRKIFTPTYLGSQIPDMFGFTAGSIMGAGLISEIGMFPKIGSLINDAVWGTKVGTGVTSAEKIIGLSDNFIKGLSTWEVGLTNSATEAMYEAKDTHDRMLQLGQSEDEANKAAWQTFGLNLAVLMPSSMFEAKTFLKGWKATTDRAAKFIDQTTGEIMKPTIGNYIKNVAKTVGEGVLAEGLWEENVQNAIQKYHDDYAKGKVGDGLVNMIGGIVSHMGDVNDPEWWDNVLGGAVMGTIMGGVHGFHEVKKDAKLAENLVDKFKSGYTRDQFEKDIQLLNRTQQEVKNADESSTLIKKVKITDENGKDKFVPVINSVTNEGQVDRNVFLGEMRKLGLIGNLDDLSEFGAHMKDRELFEHAKDLLFGQLSLNHIKNGQTEVLKNKLKSLKRDTPENKALYQLYGEIDDNNRIDKLISKVDDHDAMWHKIDKYYGGQTTTLTDENGNLIKDDKGNIRKFNIFNTDGIFKENIIQNSLKKRLTHINTDILSNDNKILANNLAKGSNETKAQEGSIEEKEQTYLNAKKKSFDNLLENSEDRHKYLTNKNKQLDELNKLPKSTKDAINDIFNQIEEYAKNSPEHLSELLKQGGSLTYLNKEGTIQKEGDDHFFVSKDGTLKEKITPDNFQLIKNGYKSPEQVAQENKLENDIKKKQAEVDDLENEQDKVKNNLGKTVIYNGKEYIIKQQQNGKYILSRSNHKVMVDGENTLTKLGATIKKEKTPTEEETIRRKNNEEIINRKIETLRKRKLLLGNDISKINDTLDFLNNILDESINGSSADIDFILKQVKTLESIINKTKRGELAKNRIEDYKDQIRTEFSIATDIANRIRSLKQEVEQLNSAVLDLQNQINYYQNILKDKTFKDLSKNEIINRISSIKKKITVLEKIINALRNAISKSINYIKEYVNLWKNSNINLESFLKETGHKTLNSDEIKKLLDSELESDRITIENYSKLQKELENLQQDVLDRIDDVELLEDIKKDEERRLKELNNKLSKYHDQIRYLNELLIDDQKINTFPVDKNAPKPVNTVKTENNVSSSIKSEEDNIGKKNNSEFDNFIGKYVTRNNKIYKLSKDKSGDYVLTTDDGQKITFHKSVSMYDNGVRVKKDNEKLNNAKKELEQLKKQKEQSNSEEINNEEQDDFIDKPVKEEDPDKKGSILTTPSVQQVRDGSNFVDNKEEGAIRWSNTINRLTPVTVGGYRLEFVTSSSVNSEIKNEVFSQSELEYEKKNGMTDGVKAILVKPDGSYYKADQNGNESKEGKVVSIAIHRAKHIEKLSDELLIINYLTDHNISYSRGDFHWNEKNPLKIQDGTVNKVFTSRDNLVIYLKEKEKERIDKIRKSIIENVGKGFKVFSNIIDVSKGRAVRDDVEKPIIGSILEDENSLWGVYVDDGKTTSNKIISRNGSIQQVMTQPGRIYVINRKGEYIDVKPRTLNNTEVQLLTKLLYLSAKGINDIKVEKSNRVAVTKNFKNNPNANGVNDVYTLSKLIFYGQNTKEGVNKERQIYLTKDGSLHLGENLVIPFNQIENSQQVRDFLKDKYFFVNNKLLNDEGRRNRPYFHPDSINDKGELVETEYKNYEDFLLKNGILKTTLVANDVQNSQFQNKYVTYSDELTSNAGESRIETPVINEDSKIEKKIIDLTSGGFVDENDEPDYEEEIEENEPEIEVKKDKSKITETKTAVGTLKRPISQKTSTPVEQTTIPSAITVTDVNSLYNKYRKELEEHGWTEAKLSNEIDKLISNNITGQYEMGLDDDEIEPMTKKEALSIIEDRIKKGCF